MSQRADLLVRLAGASFRQYAAQLVDMSVDERRIIVQQLMDNGYAYVVAHNLRYFTDIEFISLHLLVGAGYAVWVLRDRDLFDLSDLERYNIMQCCAVTDPEALRVVIQDPEWKPYEGMAATMIKYGHANFVGEHLGWFPGYNEARFKDEVHAWLARLDLRRAPGQRFMQRLRPRSAADISVRMSEKEE